MRLVISAPVVVVLAAIHFFHVHLHHFFHHLFHHFFPHLFHRRFHGPPFDYVGLTIGSIVSSAGFPGPGEALLITGGILAASGRLDIVSVILVAFVGSTIGGIIGWLTGLKAGRTLLTARGPFRRARQRALARGDRIFNRYVVIAVIMTPAWVAGVHHVRSRVYQPLNVLGAALWAVGIGLGAYYVGPPIVEAVSDIGLASLGILAALVLGAVGGGLYQRRRVRRRGGGEAADAQGSPVSPEGGSLKQGSPVSPEGGSLKQGSPVSPEGGSLKQGSPVSPEGGSVKRGSSVSPEGGSLKGGSPVSPEEASL